MGLTEVSLSVDGSGEDVRYDVGNDYVGKFLQKCRMAAFATSMLVASVISLGAAFQSLAASMEKLASFLFSLQLSFSSLLAWGLKLRLWMCRLWLYGSKEIGYPS